MKCNLRMLKVGILFVLILTMLFSSSLFAYQKDLFRIATADLPPGLDGHVHLSNTGARIYVNVYDTLMRMDAQDNSILLPALAKSWERVEDNALLINLRPNVVFHNGEKFTSTDVKYSIDRAKNPMVASGHAISLMGNIENVEIIDDLTVIITTNGPDPILEYRLASPWGAWIVPSGYTEEVEQDVFRRKPVGTGPYMVEEFRPDRVTLVAFEDYWEEQPNAYKIEYRLVPELAARITALMNNEVDMITQIPPDQIRMLRELPQLTVKTRPIANIHMLVYNTQKPPTDDQKLRQAMNLAIDRELLIKILWYGTTEVPRSHQYPDFGPLFNAERPRFAYNQEKARNLIAESNYQGEEIVYYLFPGYYTATDEAAEAILEMWRSVGINARIRYIESFFADREYNVHVWSNSMRYPDPTGGLWLLWGEESVIQAEYESWLPPARFNELGNQLSTSLNTELRYDMFQEMLDIWEDEAPGTGLWYPAENWVMHNSVIWEPFNGHMMDFREYNLQFK